jgi:hypothetical protein
MNGPLFIADTRETACVPVIPLSFVHEPEDPSATLNSLNQVQQVTA